MEVYLEEAGSGYWAWKIYSNFVCTCNSGFNFDSAEAALVAADNHLSKAGYSKIGPRTYIKN